MTLISVTGPESTGKSWLAARLAEHYRTCWVPEFARKYLEQIGRPYTYMDVLTIAKNQFAEEGEAAKKAELIFCDTDFLVTSIWCNVKYGKCHPWISEKLKQNRYGIYLLCNIDLPWEYDPLREHPEMRQELLEMYKQILEENNFNYRIISGIGDKRLENAVQEIDEFLSSQKTT